MDNQFCPQEKGAQTAFNIGPTFHLEMDGCFLILFKPQKVVGFGDTSVSKREEYSLPLRQKIRERDGELSHVPMLDLWSLFL